VTRYALVELLTADHDRSTFDCGSVAQSEWLRRFALAAQQADSARVYVIRPHGERRIAGYYALAAGSVDPRKRHAARRGSVGASRHRPHAARRGRPRQRRGLEAELVCDAFSAAAAGAGSARALLIHAETPDAADFYRRVDPALVALPSEPLHLVLLMKDLRAAIRAAAIDLASDSGMSRG
jgi:hypothetical protein